MVGDLHRCYDQELVEKYESDFETIIRGPYADKYLSYINDDPVVRDRILDGLTWAASTVKDSYRDYSSWGSCVQDCAASAVMNLSWYGQATECLSNEDRQHRNEKQKSSSCQCDSRAEAWLYSIQMLHGFAFSGATFLIGLQVFIALLWDHEEMIARPKCSCPRDLVRAKEQWLAMMASTLLIVCLWLQQTYVAYDEDRRCEFHGEQTPPANERLMLSWSVLVIVMFCVAMFAGIMPVVQ